MRKRGLKRGTPTTYRGINYRSKWEVYIAKLLLYSDYNFKYEPKRFFFGNKYSYLPDFHIPDRNLYLEVKGVLTGKDKFLLKAFSQGNKIAYLGKDEISGIFGKSANQISKLDVVNYVPTKSEVNNFKEFIENHG